MTSQNPIDALLKAEQNAEVVIQSRHDAARETLNQAMETARSIADRADKRITNIHTRCATLVETQCAAMWQAHEKEPASIIDDMVARKRLTRVANRVAVVLTSPEQGGTGDA